MQHKFPITFLLDSLKAQEGRFNYHICNSIIFNKQKGHC